MVVGARRRAPTGMAEPLVGLIGGRSATALVEDMGLETVGDLLMHLPRRYARRGELTDLASLAEGEFVTVLAEIAEVQSRRMSSRRGWLLEVVVTDGRGRLTLAFFNQRWREKQLVRGRRGLFSGKVGHFRGVRQLAHPDYELLADPLVAVDEAQAWANEVIPVYPACATVSSWTLARCVRTVLDTLSQLPDPIPAPVRDKHGLPDLLQALRWVHRPADLADVARGQHRLRWQEAFLLQVALARRRAELGALAAVPRPARPDGLLAAFDAALPFRLTAGQQAVSAEILTDMAGSHPMHRLLQGEVGSGKTVVAARAMLATVDSGGQAALLAPTEVLAAQHLRSLRALLGPLGRAGELGAPERATRVVLLTGGQASAARRTVLAEAASGAAGIVVGTHALLEAKVGFAELGLVVVDEQHRFGVEQRDSLRDKADRPPHLLVMTATPIPRTVAMTVFGDLEVSTLTELPAGRAPVATHVVPVRDKPHYLARVWARLREEVEAGHQGFVVCPRIGEIAGVSRRGLDEEEAGRAEGLADIPVADPTGDGTRLADGLPATVTELLPYLAEGPLAGLRLAALHGRMSAEAKDDVMSRLVRGEVDVLVSTTVIEVGVDVPNASVMVVVAADRFGVSQLHQLRGRVGRGQAPSVTLLVTDAEPGTGARERLEAVAATADGFELARVDLQQRREGDVLGSAQSGRHSSLRLLRVLDDEEIILAARTEATALVAEDPSLAAHPALRAAVRAELGDDKVVYLDRT